MIFYHFTTMHGARGIVRTGNIQLGRVPGFSKERPTLPGVSLTTSDQPNGHGLPDGRKITENEFQHLRRNAPDSFGLVRDGGGGYACMDHTQVRLKFDIAESLFEEYGITRAIDSYNPLELIAMDVTAHFPLGHYSDEEMLETIAAFHAGTLPRRSPTWWTAEESLPVSLMKSAAVKFEGKYHELSAEQFIAEVRTVLAEQDSNQ